MFPKLWKGVGGLVGWGVGGLVKLGPSSFLIIIRRCDIGVVLHLLGEFAKIAAAAFL